ncbi:MAG: YbjN domain-containing protein [Alphaproteobacteria bacterium]|nr:YbjN domain-containing protein [Alphaproteobacteria bacterium]
MTTMQLAKNLPLSYNPIDVVENIFAAQSFELDRRSLNEVVIEVQGKWNNMLLFFAWEANMRCLHLSCLMDIESTIEDRSKIFELLALANEELWVGHFSYWAEQNMPVFKHSIILDETEESFEGKIRQIIEIAVKECERLYPVFKVVLTIGMDPKRALYPMLMETMGEA